MQTIGLYTLEYPTNSININNFILRKYHMVLSSDIIITDITPY